MHFMDIAGENRIADMSRTNLSSRPRRTVWQTVITVLSAAVLISAEVFGAAFAGGWALVTVPRRAVGIHGQPWPEVSRPVRPHRAVSSEP
jgi:hypothetical protein